MPAGRSAPGLIVRPGDRLSAPSVHTKCGDQSCSNKDNVPDKRPNISGPIPVPSTTESEHNIDPKTDIPPPSETVLNSIQPEIMGQCALHGENILLVFENAKYSERQYQEMKEYVKAVWYLLNGYDTSVRNKGTTVSLMVFDSEVRMMNEEQFASLEMSTANEGSILILDEVMKYFKDSMINNQVLVISSSMDVTHWPIVLFECRIRVHSLRLDTSGPVLTSDSGTQSVSFQTLESLGKAGQTSLSFICQRPEPIAEIPDVPVVLVPAISPRKVDRCNIPMEVYTFYSGIDAAERSHLSQGLQQIIHGQFRHPIPILDIESTEPGQAPSKRSADELLQKHPEFIATVIVVNFDLEFSKLKMKLEVNINTFC